LDTDYGFLGNWNNYFPSNPRWIGIALSTRF
jgi:iron complex outermembrane receptor protein